MGCTNAVNCYGMVQPFLCVNTQLWNYLDTIYSASVFCDFIRCKKTLNFLRNTLPTRLIIYVFPSFKQFGVCVRCSDDTFQEFS